MVVILRNILCLIRSIYVANKYEPLSPIYTSNGLRDVHSLTRVGAVANYYPVLNKYQLLSY